MFKRFSAYHAERSHGGGSVLRKATVVTAFLVSIVTLSIVPVPAAAGPFIWSLGCFGSGSAPSSATMHWNWTQGGVPIPGAGDTQFCSGNGSGTRPATADGFTGFLSVRVWHPRLKYWCGASSKEVTKSFSPADPFDITLDLWAHCGGEARGSFFSNRAIFTIGGNAGFTSPSSPRNLIASGGDAKITLTWEAPASDGGANITDYSVYRVTSSGGESLLAQVGDVHRYTDSGLTNGVTYFYQVSAVNALGEGPKSTEASATPGTPTAPQALHARTTGAQVNLAWQPPVSQGSSPITNYRVYRGTSSGAESFLVEIGDSLTYSDSDVSNGSTYFYQVSAVNTAGEGPRGAEISATPKGGAGPGEPPFPWTPIGAGLLLLAAAALAGFQHTRIGREEVLQRKIRLLMYEHTRDHPGSSFTAIRNAMGLKNGVAAYHLHVLEKQGLVHSVSRSRHHWYYPNGDVSLWREIPLSSLQDSLMKEIGRAPGVGIRELARAVDRRASSVAYNVKALVREDMLRTERVGAKVHCFMAREEDASVKVFQARV